MNIFLDLLAKMLGKKKSVHPVIEHTPANFAEQDERRRTNFQKSFDKAKAELEKFFLSHHLSDRCSELFWDGTKWKIEVSKEDFLSMIVEIKPVEIVFESFYHGLGDSHDMGFKIGPNSNIYLFTSQYGINIAEVVNLGGETTKLKDPNATWSGDRVTRRSVIW